MNDLADGESIVVPGSGSEKYTLKNVGGVYSCSCPAWRNQSAALEVRTCKHLRRLRGESAENERTGAAAQSSPQTSKLSKGTEGSKAPAVLLAESWDGIVDVAGWWISEKLDGVLRFGMAPNFCHVKEIGTSLQIGSRKVYRKSRWTANSGWPGNSFSERLVLFDGRIEVNIGG